MGRAYIHQAGMSVFGKRAGGLWELVSEAVDDAGGIVVDIGALVIGNQAAEPLLSEGLLAAKALDVLGLDCPEAHWVNAGSASGAAALQVGCLLLNKYRNVLVLAAEKMTHLGRSAEVGRILAHVLHRSESSRGMTMIRGAARIAQAYLQSGRHTIEDWTLVALKNHANSVHNRYAHFRKEITRKKIERSPVVEAPLRLFDCAPISDGAVAVLLSATESDIEVLACESGIAESVECAGRNLQGGFTASKKAAFNAYRKSGVRASRIEIAEIHDAFTPFELVGLESVGLHAGRSAVECLRSGRYNADGELPVNASGGLKGRGHPVGASGLAQVVEMVRMMRGTGVFDFRSRRTGLAMSIGGLATQNYVTILANSN